MRVAKGSGYVAALASGTLGAMVQSDSVLSVILSGEGTKPVVGMLGHTNLALPGNAQLLPSVTVYFFGITRCCVQMTLCAPLPFEALKSLRLSKQSDTADKSTHMRSLLLRTSTDVADIVAMPSKAYVASFNHSLNTLWPCQASICSFIQSFECVPIEFLSWQQAYQLYVVLPWLICTVVLRPVCLSLLLHGTSLMRRI